MTQAIKHVPSAFNSQSTRIVLLLNNKNKQFWDNTKAVLKEKMGADRDFTATEQKSITLNILTVQYYILKINL